MLKNAVLSFILGSTAYVTMELVFRGRSHISMALAGGICMLILNILFTHMNISLFTKCLLSMVVITLVEFVTGVIVNIYMNLNVWDYSARPLNVLGQICPGFSLLWFFMGIPISFASDFINNT